MRHHDVCSYIVRVNHRLRMFRKIGSADDVETLRLILKVVDDLIRYRGRIEWDQRDRHILSKCLGLEVYSAKHMVSLGQ